MCIIFVNFTLPYKLEDFMRSNNQKIIFGALIILAGILLLLNNFRLFNLDAQFWWGIAFAAFGIIFINVYRQNSKRKGPLVVGIILLVIGFFSIIDSLDFVSDEIIGVIFLWGLAAIFISVYVRHNDRWWAIIPGGALLILGFLVLVEEFRILDNDFFGFIFLFGISLVFWFLYLIKDEKNKLEWANIIAVILTIVSFFVLTNEWESKIADIIFPLSVIFCGAYLIFRAFLTDKQQVHKQKEN